MNKRVHFLCNGVYTSKVGGGDIHMIHLARAALARGYKVNFFGGHALQRQLEGQLSGYTLMLTDRRALPTFDDSVVRGQFRMFLDYTKRLSGTLKQLSLIESGDVAYAVGDFWYDVVPLVRSRAGGKMLVYHMRAPTFKEIAVRGRADVDPTRIAALHYATSQTYSLRRFRRVPHKRILHVHPGMRDQLLGLGFQPNELRYVSFGVEPRRPSGNPAKVFDVIWIGGAWLLSVLGVVWYVDREINKNFDNELAEIFKDVKRLPPRPQWLSSEQRPVSALPPVTVPARPEPVGVAAQTEADQAAPEKAAKRRPTGQARPATA